MKSGAAARFRYAGLASAGVTRAHAASPGLAGAGAAEASSAQASSARASSAAAPGYRAPDHEGGITSGGAGISRAPFGGPHLRARVLPFAVVAVVAELSLVLPGGIRSVPAAVVSLVLLAATGAAFLLPWARLPGWASVLVPLCYTGSVLALVLAAGATSGVGIVILIPLIWTALFHRRWESACVVAAIVTVEVIVSVTPEPAADLVIVRRVALWAALGALISIATHGLRDRVRRSQRESAELESRLRELTVLADRDRIATDFQDLVIKRLFAAGLSLQAAVSMTARGSVASRIESAIDDLDEAMRLTRQSIFDLRASSRGGGLRQGILDLCGELAAAGGSSPGVIFSGPVDDAVPPRTGQQLLQLLGEALAVIGGWARPARVEIMAGDGVRLIVEGTGPAGPAAQPGGAERRGAGDARLREMTGRLGAELDIEEIPGGTRFAWRLPVS